MLEINLQLILVHSAQIEDYNREQSDVDGQLERLQAKIRDLEAEEAEATSAIKLAQQICGAAGITTKQEVARLKGERMSFSPLWCLIVGDHA